MYLQCARGADPDDSYRAPACRSLAGSDRDFRPLVLESLRERRPGFSLEKNGFTRVKWRAAPKMAEPAEAARQHELSTTPPASTVVPEPALLPVTSIRHIMKRAMGGEQDAITDETVSVVQRCTTEFVSLVVSEARVRVAKEGRTSVTYSDIATALNALGFKQFQEPLKAHMTLHYGGSAVKRPPKRQRVEDDAVAHGAVSRCNPIGKALALPPADREGRTPAPASGSMRRQVACGQCDACCRDDCGTCLNCRDKPKFGGGGARSANGCRARLGGAGGGQLPAQTVLWGDKAVRLGRDCRSLCRLPRAALRLSPPHEPHTLSYVCGPPAMALSAGVRKARCLERKCRQPMEFNSASPTAIDGRSDEQMSPHVCSFPGCDLRFTQESNLKTHLRLHYSNTDRACATLFDAAVAYEQ